MSRDLIKSFKEERWSGPGQIDAFVEAAGLVTAQEMAKLLDVVLGKSGDATTQTHRTRAFVKLVEANPDHALFPLFVKALKVSEGSLRKQLADLLIPVNSVSHHGDLAALLRSTDASLRRLAGATLAKVGNRAVFEPLLAMVRENGFPGRIEAIDAAIGIGGTLVLPLLTAVMSSGTNAERTHALRYLRDPEWVQRDAAGALAAARLGLASDDQRVVISAIGACSVSASEDDWFEIVGPLLESPNLEIVSAAVEGLKNFRSPRAMAALTSAFRMGPNSVRMTVLQAAKEIGDVNVFPLLISATGHKNVTVRSTAGSIIADLSQDNRIEVERAIIWLLRSRDPNVRRIAVDIAQRVGDESGELWPKLLRFLRDEDWWVRERVTDALVEMGGSKLTRPLASYLSDPSDVVRRHVVSVLGRVRDPQALGPLVRTATEDPDWWVKECAIQAIGALKDRRATRYLLSMLQKDEEVRLACVEALEVLEDRETAPYVAAALGAAPDVDLRLAILKCLGVIGGPEQVQWVLPLQQDPEPRVIEAARALLVRWNVQAKLGDMYSTAVSGLDRILGAALSAGAEDVLVEAGSVPYMKKEGSVEPLSTRVLTADDVRQLLEPRLSAGQFEELSKLRDVDFSFEVKSLSVRFRGHVFQQSGGLGAVFRVIRDRIPDFQSLGLPEIVSTFGDVKNGLVLVGGPTGSGKSTTLAAMIDYINKRHGHHIVTLEDPIETMHRSKLSLLTQREIGSHSITFGTALRATLRQDPDVILVGELRDLTTISFAITAAETGHLVFGTVHAVSADSCIDRLVNAFPGGQQPQVRNMLATNLRAVVCQHLIPRKDGAGRILAAEVLLNNDAVANLIRKGKTFQIATVVATSRGIGMQSMDLELMRMAKEGLISAEDAYMRAMNKKEFEELIASSERAREGAPAVPAPGLPAPRREPTPAPIATPAPQALRREPTPPPNATPGLPAPRREPTPLPNATPGLPAPRREPTPLPIAQPAPPVREDPPPGAPPPGKGATRIFELGRSGKPPGSGR